MGAGAGSEKQTVDTVGDGVLEEGRDFVEALRLLAHFLEDQVELGLRSDDDADEVKDRMDQSVGVAQRGIAADANVFKVIALLDEAVRFFALPARQVDVGGLFGVVLARLRRHVRQQQDRMGRQAANHHQP